MKNIKTKALLSLVIFLSVVGFVGTVDAAAASLYVSPASSTRNAGSVFNASVGFNTSGNQVCVVKGTLVFDNLSCQSIAVVEDSIKAFSLPTCSNPNFLVGIPKCTTIDKVLFTVSVKAGNAGVASIKFTGVNIIGAGISVGSVSTVGNYTINAVPTQTPTQETITPEEEILEETTQETTTPEGEVAQAGLLEASKTGNPFLASLGNVLTSPIVIWIIIILLVLAAIYFIAKKVYRKK